MKLEDACGHYEYFSGEASKLARQLALAALAVVWIFKTDVAGGGYRVPATLKPAALAAVMALMFDVLQYGYGALFWGWYHRSKERQHLKPDDEFEPPREVNWPTLTFFWAKLVAIAVAYGFLLAHLAPAFR